MSAAAVELTHEQLAPIIRAALKDKRYRATSLGALVGRYCRWFRNEKGASDESVRDYESVLARMALTLGDKQPTDITIEDLRDVIDLWAMREAATRAKITSVIRSFWEWAEDEGHVTDSPARKLRRPKKPRKAARMLPISVDARLIAATTTARDRLALLVLLDCGVRRRELGGIRVRDLDLARRNLIVYGKGAKERTIPIRGRIVLAAEEYLLDDLAFVGRRPEPDDYLLYPEKRTPAGQIYWANPKHPCAMNTVHRWWYRMLRQAGLVGAGVTSGMNMHRARHTFAQDVRRAYPDMGTVQQLLGHADPSTTIALYGNYSPEDMERAMDAFARSLRAKEESE
ncbi:Site-specific recombinase XerD [Gaiella occulta]|uniref:Site-specific recombinase XerD n=1 Tax=Gaiella occulta TaxID=1002870 RepID=A0A7M2YTB9_9ACTN|nr:tyrosine-type recombinase/integrase [Gaiella occulta]RDI73343.1 Site-specific recombinase XerD [Gaiella occulta]